MLKENHENSKHQTPNTKSQTNPNDPNSKFKTNDRATSVSNSIITGIASFAK
jgi:hypothetical protein